MGDGRCWMVGGKPYEGEGMTESDKVRLRRLITDLEPFTEALRRVLHQEATRLPILALRALEASDGLERFIKDAKHELRK